MTPAQIRASSNYRQRQKAKIARLQDRVSNMTIGLEEIRDAVWPGDDAIERIRRCADHWLSGEEEDLDARMRSDLLHHSAGQGE